MPISAPSSTGCSEITLSTNCSSYNNEFWKDVHKYENARPKRDEKFYDELCFIDRILWP